MGIVSFQYSKLDATRVGAPKGKISITHDIKIENIKEAGLNMGDAEKKGVYVEFSYTITYKPSLGKIRIEGSFLDLNDKSKDIADKWKKDSEIDVDYKENIYNAINQKAALKGIMLAEQLGLPSPLKIPKLVMKK